MIRFLPVGFLSILLFFPGFFFGKNPDAPASEAFDNQPLAFHFPPCDTGISTLLFEVNRTTFGFQNAAYSVPFDPVLANQKAALPCDSVQMKVLAVAGDLPSSGSPDSLNLVIRYKNQDGSNSSIPTFLFHDGKLRFTHSASVFDCDLLPGMISSVQVGGDHFFIFSLDACLAGLGFSLENGDSIELLADFTIAPDAPLHDFFLPLPKLEASGVAVLDGVSFNCDPVAETFTLGKTETVLDFPNTNAGLPQGCQPGELTYRFFVPDNDFAAVFGDELRPAPKVDSIVFDFDPGWLTAFDQAEVFVSIPGHPAHGSSYFELPPLHDFPSGRYVARFDTLAHSPPLNVVQTYFFDLKIKLLANCTSATGGLSGGNDYQIAAKVFYEDRRYARFIGDGSCAETKVDSAASEFVFEDLPGVELQALSPASDTLSNGVGEWLVQICNASTSGVGATWLAIGQAGGDLSVFSVENVSNPGAPVGLSLKNYGSDVFVFAPGLAPGACLNLRVRAGGSGCQNIDFQVITGWLCALPDDPDWTPETYPAACPVPSLTLSLVVAAGDFFTHTQSIFQVPNCAGSVTLCLNLPASSLASLEILDNGQLFNGGLGLCNGSNLALEIFPGSHFLEVTNTLTGCFDTALVTVFCAQPDSLEIEILLHQTDTFCLSGSELPGGVASLANACFDGSNVSYAILNDSCLALTGNWVGQENACLVICDSLGFCDSTFLTINVLHPLAEGLKDTITVTQERRFCFDPAQLNLAGQIVSIENLCENQGGDEVSFELDAAQFCVGYLGLATGVDSACIRICDDLGFCDTINICVAVVPGSVQVDTVYLGVDTVIFCFDENLLPTPVESVEDICPATNGDNVTFSISGTCVTYFGASVGVDTACIRLEDALGNVALIHFVVTTARTYPATFCDTIFVGEEKIYCLDTTELPGRVVSHDNFCPGAGFADFFVIPQVFCVSYRGVEPGKDTACVVLCDDRGVCDTTYFCIVVEEYFDPPTLGDDHVSTEKITPVVIDFLANDTLLGGIDTIYVLGPFFSGNIFLNSDHTFTYVPIEPYCGRTDEFRYVACNPNGCDTATVSIEITCVELTVFTAVSPNNDDVNDVFFIAKIEEFPGSRLTIFNRWGNQVFQTNDYRNNWPGTWGHDIELPDGTYFYLLEWTDNGVTTKQQGYIELFR